MSITNYKDPIVPDWKRDENGVKISELRTNEQKQVIGNKITLDYLPDIQNRVFINNTFVEIDIKKEITLTNQFKVNYEAGYITVHESLNGQFITIERYYARGVIYYPSSRIWTEIDDNGNVVETLRDIISTNKLYWKPPVANFSAISSTYPSPLVGWTVQTLDTKNIYRWDGTTWVYIQNINISVANNLTETVTGKALDATQGKALDNKIGNLSTITTTEKSNLAGAISEVKNEVTIHKDDYAKLKGNLDTATVDQVLSSNGDGTSTFKTIEKGGIAKALEVLTVNPTGEDLYEGRIWIKKYLLVTEVDTMSMAAGTGGAASIGVYNYKCSPNYKPTTNISIKEIQVKFITSITGSEHTNSNPIRCRICTSTGGKPNESSVLGTSTYTEVPIAKGVLFNGIFKFSSPVNLLAGVLYHFALDVPSGTGSTMCQTYLAGGQPTNDAISANIGAPDWTDLNEGWTVCFKIIRIE